MHWHVHREYCTPNFTLRVESIFDDDYTNDVQDEHGNPCQETADKLASGEWAAYGYRVSIYAKGVPIAKEYIWGCIYPSADEGYANRVSGYLSSLVGDAIDEARKVIRSMPRVRD